MTPNDRPPKMLVNGAAKIMADELYVGIKGMAKLKGTYGHSFVAVPGFGYIDCEAIMETVLKTLAARGEITWQGIDPETSDQLARLAKGLFLPFNPPPTEDEVRDLLFFAYGLGFGACERLTQEQKKERDHE